MVQSFSSSATAPTSGTSLASGYDVRHVRPIATMIANEASRLCGLHVGDNRLDIPPPEVVLKRAEEIQTELQNADVDTEKPCSKADAEPCWILGKLTTFNRILQTIDIEIQEEEPQKLRVRFLELQDASVADFTRVLVAYALLQQLVKKHKCIKTLHLYRKNMPRTSYPQLLCDALSSRADLKHMAIGCIKFTSGTVHAFVPSLCQMSALETLCVSALRVKPSTAARIGYMIEKARCLRRVKFRKCFTSPAAATALMEKLCRNDSLEVVSLDKVALGAGGACFLGVYLTTSTKLRYLSLKSMSDFHEQHMLLIAEGLRANRSLEKLRIVFCFLNPGGIGRLADVLKENTTLKHLKVTNCFVTGAGAESVAVMLASNTSLLVVDLSSNYIDDNGGISLARALKLNARLEKLDLDHNRIGSNGAVSLIDALAGNNVLKELSLRGVDTRAVANSGDGRVQLSCDSACDSATTQLRLSSARIHKNADLITSVHLSTSCCIRINADCLRHLFAALALLPCLKSLRIECDMDMDNSAAREFARLLGRTRTLEYVVINALRTVYLARQTIMKGLAKNHSVLHVDMLHSKGFPWPYAIADMLKNNTSLTHFGGFHATPSDLKVIARALRENRVLTSLMVSSCGDACEAVFEVNEILRRNVSYLSRAVEFAMDPRKFGNRRSPAEIFDSLRHTDSLRKLLVGIAGPGGAAEAMRKARRHVTANFFDITGVCRVPVTCWPHPEGARQIDCLNFDTWLHIFQYLKVTDILT